jgi:hypothetical protein
MQLDPHTGQHLRENVVLSVASKELAEVGFASADRRGFVVQLPVLYQ